MRNENWTGNHYPEEYGHDRTLCCVCGNPDPMCGATSWGNRQPATPEPTQSPTSPPPGAGVHGEVEDPKNASLPPQSERQGPPTRPDLTSERYQGPDTVFASDTLLRDYEAYIDAAESERDQLRARVAELEAHLPRMDGPSRVEYLERRVTELEREVNLRTDELDGFWKAGASDPEEVARFRARIQELEARVAELEAGNGHLNCSHGSDGKVIKHGTGCPDRVAIDLRATQETEECRALINRAASLVTFEKAQARIRDLETANAALEKRLKEPWLPIETAPRDGRFFPCLVLPGPRNGAALPLVGEACWSDDCWLDGNYEEIDQPDLWIPFPDPYHGRQGWCCEERANWGQCECFPPTPAQDVSETRQTCAERECTRDDLRRLIDIVCVDLELTAEFWPGWLSTEYRDRLIDLMLSGHQPGRAPLPSAPADDVSKARQSCAEEGCAAHSEEMRQIVERELRAFAEASLEEDELYTCPSCDEVDSLVFDKDFWRCICGAPEDESGYRPAGEVERG